MWIRITGYIGFFGGRGSINATDISEIKNFNELTYNWLHVINGHKNNKNKFTSIQTIVLKTIKKPENEQQEQGCSFNRLCQTLKDVDKEVIKDAIINLVKLGTIYQPPNTLNYKYCAKSGIDQEIRACSITPRPRISVITGLKRTIKQKEETDTKPNLDTNPVKKAKN